MTYLAIIRFVTIRLQLMAILWRHVIAATALRPNSVTMSTFPSPSARAAVGKAGACAAGSGRRPVIAATRAAASAPRPLLFMGPQAAKSPSSAMLDKRRECIISKPFPMCRPLGPRRARL